MLMLHRIPAFLVITLFAAACSDSDFGNSFELDLYREIAFNSLTQNEKSTLSENWQNAEVIFGKFSKTNCDNTFIYDGDNWFCFAKTNSQVVLTQDSKLVGVIFNTKHDPLLGPLIVILDDNSKNVIGHVLRL